MDYSAAQAVADKPNDSRIFWLLTRDEFAGRSPYAERPAEQDLIVVLQAANEDSSSATDSGAVVAELRFFLAAPGISQVQLLGKTAALLSTDAVTSWLGPPANRTDANDGKTHLTYYFESQDPKTPGLKLVTSHDLDGHCFAFAVSMEAVLPK